MSIFKKQEHHKEQEPDAARQSHTAAGNVEETSAQTVEAAGKTSVCEQKQAEAERAQAHGPKPTADSIKQSTVDVLKNIYDPEIPVNIYDLGLIYDISVEPLNEGFRVKILMTMTAPDCPEAEFMFQDVRQMVQYIEGVVDVDVELTFDPPWSPDRLTDDVKLELGLM